MNGWCLRGFHYQIQMSILKTLRSVGQKLEAGSCCGAEPGDEAHSVTQPAPGAAFRRALAAKCQGCLSRRLPPCPFLPYHPAGRLRAGRKPSPAFLALLPEVSGGLSPRRSLLGALLGASLALALGETSPSLSGSPFRVTCAGLPTFGCPGQGAALLYLCALLSVLSGSETLPPLT